MHRLAVVLVVEYSKLYDPRIARSIEFRSLWVDQENTIVHASIVTCRLGLYYLPSGKKFMDGRSAKKTVKFFMNLAQSKTLVEFRSHCPQIIGGDYDHDHSVSVASDGSAD
jgi:exonuclease III